MIGRDPTDLLPGLQQKLVEEAKKLTFLVDQQDETLTPCPTPRFEEAIYEVMVPVLMKEEKTEEQLIRDELLQFSTIQNNEVAEVWWFKNKLNYPYLYPLARALHGIPASSSDPEREFSDLGGVITQKINSISSQSVKDQRDVSHDTKKRRISK